MPLPGSLLGVPFTLPSTGNSVSSGELACLRAFSSSNLVLQFLAIVRRLVSSSTYSYRYSSSTYSYSDIKSTSTQTFKPRTRALQPIDELFLVLIRLQLGLLEQDLAHRFNIGIATVSHICVTWIKFLNQQLRPLITWPSRADIDANMPAEFYPSTRVIIDCTKVFTEVPHLCLYSRLPIPPISTATHSKA